MLIAAVEDMPPDRLYAAVPPNRAVGQFVSGTHAAHPLMGVKMASLYSVQYSEDSVTGAMYVGNGVIAGI